MMRNMKLINLTIWMFGGIIWGFFMYMSFNDFKFTFDSRLFFIVLVGSVFFGLVSGLLFGRVSYIHGNSYTKYLKILDKRLKKGRKLNKTIYEFNIMKDIQSIEQVRELWSIFERNIIEFENNGVVISNINKWYERVDMILLEVTSGKKSRVSDVKKLEVIQVDLAKLDIMTLEKYGIIQINILLAKMMELLQSHVEVRSEEVDEINTRLIYYMYLFKLGLANQKEFNDFINRETLKDNANDVFIDLQFAIGKGANDIIEVLYNYVKELEEISHIYYMDLISRFISYEIIVSYREEDIQLDEYLVLIGELYSFFPEHSELHYLYQWEYHPEYGGQDQGIDKQEEYAINISDFFKGD